MIKELNAHPVKKNQHYHISQSAFAVVLSPDQRHLIDLIRLLIEEWNTHGGSINLIKLTNTKGTPISAAIDDIQSVVEGMGKVLECFYRLEGNACIYE